MLFARKLDWLRRIGLSFLVSYLFLVIAVTVFLRTPSAKSNLILELFRSYKEYNTNDFTWFEIRANVLLFIPIGFLLPMAIKKPFYIPLITGVGISVTIELLQLVLRRGTCEIDDLISNSIGLLIGYCAFLLVKAIVFAIKKLCSRYKAKHL